MILAGDEQLDYKHLQAWKISLKNSEAPLNFSVVSLGRDRWNNVHTRESFTATVEEYVWVYKQARKIPAGPSRQ